jgi:AcrR family transcriptional regulator
MPSDLKTKTGLIRRQHILDAAIRVFDAKGFRGATIRDIATEAGVSDGTVYNVFANKEALLLAILEPLLVSSSPMPLPSPTAGAIDPTTLLQAMLAARWRSLTPETLAMMRTIWSEALTNRELASLYLDQILTPTLQTPAPLFHELAKSGAIGATDVPLTLRIIVAAFLGLALMKLLGDETLEHQSGDIPSGLADMLLNGLLPRHPSGADHDKP